MPTFSELRSSKYLSKTDIPDKGLLLTIKNYSEENVAQDDASPQVKHLIHFAEKDVKPMVLNVTNGNMIAMICGLDPDTADINQSIGAQIVVYYDPTIMMKGQRVGGIRVRARAMQRNTARPAAQPQRQAPPPPTPIDNAEFDNDAGFAGDDDFDAVF